MTWLKRGDQWGKTSATRIIEFTELLVLDKDNTVKAAVRVVSIERPGSHNPVVYLRDIEVID